jgi:CBS domain-containing protein
MGHRTDAGAPARVNDDAMAVENPPRTDPPLPVGAVMTPFPVVVRVDTSLDEIAELLAENDISGLPVVDASGVLVGVVSQTDLIRAAASSGHGLRPWSGYTARHVMTRHPVIAHEGEPLVEAARRLERHGIHRLVIVADDGTTPVGIVSISDLLPLLVDAADV